MIPLGRAHLFHCLAALRDVNRMKSGEVILSGDVLTELRWWREAMSVSRDNPVPLASRLEFPGADEPGVLTDYGDASREFDESTGLAAKSSGFGAWCLLPGTDGELEFCYFVGRWTHEECKMYSINVLESATQNFGGVVFVAHAETVGLTLTHRRSFVDNRTAEFVAERGRTQSDAMHALHLRRQQHLLEHGMAMASLRVASIRGEGLRGE